MGSLLPDIDHFIYVYFLMPHELTSQRVSSMMVRKDVRGVFSLLAATRGERTKLVFHTVLFQIIFLVLTFFVVTSSASLFGVGIVLGFSLHLLVDQYEDMKQLGHLDNWFKGVNLDFVKGKEKQYWYFLFSLVLILGFLV